MNSEEARRVLAEMARLNRLPYGPDMVEAWANALHDVTEIDALAAVVALVRSGVKDVSAAAVTGWLRDRRNDEKRKGQARMTIEAECECTLAKLCDMHRQIGLAALHKIKLERPAGRAWSLTNQRGGA